MRSLIVPALIGVSCLLGACQNRIGSSSTSPGYPSYGPPTALAPAYEAQRGPAPAPPSPYVSSTRSGTAATAPGTMLPRRAPAQGMPPRTMPAPSGGGGGLFAQDPPFDQVLARARSAGKPIFLYFETMRCGWCDRLKRETFSVSSVQNRLRSGFIVVRYDAGRPNGRSLAQRYGMPGYPVMVVADASGREIGRIVGFRDANALIGELAGVLIPAGTSPPESHPCVSVTTSPSGQVSAWSDARSR